MYKFLCERSKCLVIVHLTYPPGLDYRGRMGKRRYPEKKMRDLSEEESKQIRARIAERKGDTEGIAEEFKCSESQVAGVKAAMNRK